MAGIKVTALMLFSFGIALLLGLFIGAQFISQQAPTVVSDSSSLSNVGYFFLYVIFATAILLLALKYYKGKKLFLYAELLLEFSALQILLSIFLSDLLSFIAALALVVVRFFVKELKQPLLFVASIIVGALLGHSFDFFPAVILAFLLAAYDYFAVFKSKHMVTLAKELQKREAAFAIQFSSGKRKYEESDGGTRAKAKGARGEKPLKKGESILLGTGDFVIPVMLSVSLLKTSVLSALFTALGAFVGLAVLLVVMQKTKGYYPALPPIVLFSAVFYSASLLLA